MEIINYKKAVFVMNGGHVICKFHVMDGDWCV